VIENGTHFTHPPHPVRVLATEHHSSWTLVMEATFACVWNFEFQFVPPLKFTQCTLARHPTTTNRGTHVCVGVRSGGIQNQNFPQSHALLPGYVEKPPHDDLDLFLCPCAHVTSTTGRSPPAQLVCALSVTDLLGELQVHLRVTFSGVSVVTNCVNLNTSGE
jgi:hypothetical protein